MVDVYIARSVASISMRGEQSVRLDCASLDEGFGACFAAVRHCASRWRRPRVHVWLSAALARPFLVEPVHGLRKWSEAVALAEAAAAAATGFDRACRVELEAWPAEAAAIAVAVEAATIQSLERSAEEAGVRIGSIRPWWALVLDRGLAAWPKLRMLCVTEPDAMLVLAGQQGRFEVATTYDPKPSHEQQRSLIARLSLTSAVPNAHLAIAEWRLAESNDDGLAGLRWAQRAEATA